MKLTDITENDIDDIADSRTILEHGKKYYRKGMVKSLSVEDDTIHAKVRGTYSTYTVEIEISGEDEDDSFIDCYCDCPYGGSNCKHIVAVLYKWINEKSRISSANGKAKAQPKFEDKGLSAITLDFIEKNASLDNLVCALDLIKGDLVLMEKNIPDPKSMAIIRLNILKPERVLIEAHTNQYNSGIYISKRCTCDNQAYGNDCVHITAGMLMVFFSSNKDQSFDEYDSRIRSVSASRKYSMLTNRLDNIKPELLQAFQQKQQKHHYFFRINKSGQSLVISAEKGIYLKKGGIGASSRVSERHIEDENAMSASKRNAFRLFFMYVKNISSWGGNTLTMNYIDNGLQHELLCRLKELYTKEPDAFHGCAFLGGKAGISMSISAKDGKAGENKGESDASPNSPNYLFNIHAKMNPPDAPEKAFDLGSHYATIIGDDQLWVHTFDPSPSVNNFVLFEVDTKYPDIVKALKEQSSAEISSGQLKGFIDKYYLKLSSIGNIALPKEYEITEESTAPVPRIYLRDCENTFAIALRFLYKNHEVDFGSLHDIVFRDSTDRLIKIMRDTEGENKYYSVLLDNHTAERNSILQPSVDPYTWLADVSKNLISLGYEIYGSDKLLNHRVRPDEPMLDLEVSSGIDWFDLKADVKFGTEKVPFDRIASALSHNERFIRLSDGSMGVIPKKWLNRLAGVAGLLNHDENSDSMKAHNSQIAVIEALIGIADKYKEDQKFHDIREKFKHFREIKETPLPKNLNGVLRDYQKAGYNWLHFLKEFSFGGCLADEMGLGKTLQVLSLLLYEKENGNKTPSLVVVPTSLVFNWVKEVGIFAPDLKVYVHHGQDRSKDISGIISDYDIIVTTYGTLRNDIDTFIKHTFHYTILDESQQIKNPFSKVAKSAYSLKSAHRLVLTGTPVENNSLELWSQFAFLNPGLLGNMDYFKTTFSKSIEKDKDEDKMAALRNMVNPFLLSRKKSMVAKDLPEKQVTILYCDMDGKQREVYEYWKNKYREEIVETIHEKGFMQAKMKILQGLMRLRQICNHPVLVDESYAGESGKFNVLMDQIEEVINSGHKVLIYSSFVKMLAVFRDRLTRENIPFAYLDGSTRDRKSVVEQFQADDSVKAFLISLKAGGLGLNLTAADYVFIVDPWWNPAAEMQAIDRTHRIGQKKNVFVYKAIVKDSVEEKILELQETKLELVKNIIVPDDGILKKLTRKDISTMFG